MSDRAVEDEMMDEARKFGHTMAALSRKHAQARGWWEQRKVRREISLTMRNQRRTEKVDRLHHLAWTSQMVDRYQVSAQARQERTLDPRASTEDRRRDQVAASNHLEYLRERIVGNDRLTEVERGIALDSLESARAFPHQQTRTREMLERAPKVRGLEALRYRAQLARDTERVQARHQRRGIEQAEPAVDRSKSARPTGELTTEAAEAIQGLRRTQLEWNTMSDLATPQGRDRMAENWRHAARSAEETGFTPERIEWEFRNTEENSRYAAHVHSLSHPESNWGHTYSFHPDERTAAAWVHQHVQSSNWAPGAYLNADVHERGNITESVHHARGGVGHVAAQTAHWSSSTPERKQESSRSHAQLGALPERQAQHAQARPEKAATQPLQPDRTSIQAAEQHAGQQIPASTGTLSQEQREAIQQVRYAQLAWDVESPRASDDDYMHLTQQWDSAWRAANDAGFTEQRIDSEFQSAWKNSQFTSRVQAFRAGGEGFTPIAGFHPTEQEAVQWVAQQAGDGGWGPKLEVETQICKRGDSDPVRYALGDAEHIASRATGWASAQQRSHDSEQQRGDTELEALKQRHHLSIEHNAELADQNATLTRQLTAVRAEHDQLAAERDRYKSERDESVQKLAQRTPIAERLGSHERQQTEKTHDPSTSDTSPEQQHSHAFGNAFAGLSTNAFANGYEQKGMSR